MNPRSMLLHLYIFGIVGYYGYVIKYIFLSFGRLYAKSGSDSRFEI